jgi:hypothetical protein
VPGAKRIAHGDLVGPQDDTELRGEVRVRAERERPPRRDGNALGDSAGYRGLHDDSGGVRALRGELQDGEAGLHQLVRDLDLEQRDRDLRVDRLRDLVASGPPGRLRPALRVSRRSEAFKPSALSTYSKCSARSAKSRSRLPQP